MKEQSVQLSSGNIFADLGLENPEELLLKARLGFEVANSIELQGKNYSAYSVALQISTASLEALRNNPLDFSTRELLRFLDQLDKDVRK